MPPGESSSRGKNADTGGCPYSVQFFFLWRLFGARTNGNRTIPATQVLKSEDAKVNVLVCSSPRSFCDFGFQDLSCRNRSISVSPKICDRPDSGSEWCGRSSRI